MNKKLLTIAVIGTLALVGCSQKNEQVTDKPQDDVLKQEIVQETEKEVVEEKQKTEDDKNTSSLEKHEDPPKVEIPKETTDKEEPSKEPSEPVEKPVDKPTPPPVENKPAEELPPEPPKEEVIETPVKQEAMAQDVMNKINNYRIENGLKPLESTKYYQDKADAHALAMAEERALWHADNGECITNHPDPFNAWINSPEHKEIILRENNTKGVVSIYYVDGYYYSVFRTAW